MHTNFQEEAQIHTNMSTMKSMEGTDNEGKHGRGLTDLAATVLSEHRSDDRRAIGETDIPTSANEEQEHKFTVVYMEKYLTGRVFSL